VSSTWEYAAGRISALEASLLPDRTWNRLLSSPGIDDVLKVLGETWYGRLIHSDGIEEALSASVSAAEDELAELSPSEALVKGILVRRDVRNARYVWKDLASGGGGEVPREPDGTLSASLFQRAWNDSTAAAELPLEFRVVLEDIQRSAQGGDTLRVDLKMDHLAAEVEKIHLGSLAGELRELPRTRIELRNFLTAGRFAVDELPSGQVGEWLLAGGFHTPEEVLEAGRKNRLPDALSEIRGFEGAASALKEALDAGSFLVFQRESDRVVMKLLSRFASTPFGPGLLASYVLGRELEVFHLSLLAAAKRAGMDIAKLQARLPR
jgi:vacuolar-type H+-ATPase subunit C/Vma6